MLAKLGAVAKSCAATAKEVTMGQGARKYSLFLICLGALTLGFGIGGLLPAVASQYGIFVGGVVGLYGVYCSGNVASKWSPVAKEDAADDDSAEA